MDHRCVDTDHQVEIGDDAGSIGKIGAFLTGVDNLEVVFKPLQIAGLATFVAGIGGGLLAVQQGVAQVREVRVPGAPVQVQVSR